MAKKDPLYLAMDQILHSGNKSGRPLKKEIIQFGPQPQSLISKLLQESKKIIKLEYTIEPDSLKDIVVPSDDDSSLHDDSDGNNLIKSEKETEPQNIAGDKKYLCTYPNCNYSSKSSSNLTKHKRTHSEEKPYLCDKCSFNSKFINSLKTHRRIHTNERPYKCKFCNYCCNSSSNLKKHCKHRHSNG